MFGFSLSRSITVRGLYVYASHIIDLHYFYGYCTFYASNVLQESLKVDDRLVWDHTLVVSQSCVIMGGSGVAELVNAATSENLKEMDWTKSIEICELVARDHGYNTYCMQLILIADGAATFSSLVLFLFLSCTCYHKWLWSCFQYTFCDSLEKNSYFELYSLLVFVVLSLFGNMILEFVGNLL